MSSDELSIRVDGLSKRYEIYSQPADRLKQMILPKVRRWTHQADRAYFHEFWALRDVGFDVKRGETVGIVGRNGSGKSTLLQLICGTLTPTLGTVNVHGRVAALLELGSGFNPEFTGRENAYLNATVIGLNREEIDARFEDIVAFADIGEFIEQPVKTYSSGMYIRLAFAVAISVTPDILIIDEALSVGDEAFQRKCFARINAIRDAGATVLFVSHSAGTVVQLCDRAILLDGGESLMMGRSKQVVTAYQRLLYAPSEKRESLRAELLAHHGGGEYVPSLDPEGAEREDLQMPMIKVTDVALTERYDPGLLPQSTVRYVSHGAVILDPHFVNANGKRVNVLVPGNEYVYKYAVEFSAPATRVSFGMMFKSVTGVELFGMNSHADGDSIAFVEAGRRFEVEFRFLSMFLPGTYFTNAGCNGCSESGQSGFLHRIVDAAVFKIEVKETDRGKAGFYDLAAEPSCRINEYHTLGRVQA